MFDYSSLSTFSVIDFNNYFLICNCGPFSTFRVLFSINVVSIVKSLLMLYDVGN